MNSTVRKAGPSGVVPVSGPYSPDNHKTGGVGAGANMNIIVNSRTPGQSNFGKFATRSQQQQSSGGGPGPGGHGGHGNDRTHGGHAAGESGLNLGSQMLDHSRVIAGGGGHAGGPGGGGGAGKRGVGGPGQDGTGTVGSPGKRSGEGGGRLSFSAKDGQSILLGKDSSHKQLHHDGHHHGHHHHHHHKPQWVATKKICKFIVDNTYFTIFTTILTLYALFGDDIRMASTNEPADVTFDILTVSCLIVFSIELVAASIGKDEYFLGFHFWLDFVATGSLIFDITTVAEELFSTESENSESGNVARAGRASRAGTRAGRVVRIVRLIRLIRIVKLYKTAMEARQQALKRRAQIEPGFIEEESDDELDEAEDHEKKHKQSRVGKMLTDLTTIRIVVLVLSMLLILPFFSLEYQNQKLNSSPSYGADQVFRHFVDKIEPKYTLMGGDDSAIKANITSSEIAEYADLSYQDFLFWYIYYHNPNSVDVECGTEDLCSYNFASNLFWIGFTPGYQNVDSQNKPIQPHADTIIPKIYKDSAQLNEYFSATKNHLKMFNIPLNVIDRIRAPWVNACKDDVNLEYGISLHKDPLFCPRKRRYSERSIVFPLSASQKEIDQYGSFVFYFDKQPFSRMDALFSIFTTLFVTMILGFAAYFFNRDSNELVLQPIERMIAKMERIRENPLEAIKLGDEEYRREEIKKKQRQQERNRANQRQTTLMKQRQNYAMAEKKPSAAEKLNMFIEKMMISYRTWVEKRKERKAEEKLKKEQRLPMETIILEKTIIKLGGLLVLGFGEAGAEIIGQNMKGSDSAGVNALIPGQKVDAIFGFCGVRHFAIATQVLQDKVMLYLNQICEIVHGCVDDFLGAPNKNSGDTFLLVWRLTGMDFARTRKIADLALICVLHILGAINQSPILFEYRSHPGFQQRLQHYRVALNFGLNSGWAIEGAIGSEFKIDAGYLSPNVNMAERLQETCERYSVFVLVSHWFTELCSKLTTAQYLRTIDHIIEIGALQPVRLYCCDVDVFSVKIEYKNPDSFVKNKFECRKIREQQKTEKLTDPVQTVEYWFSRELIAVMRARFNEQFLNTFSTAYKLYEVGDWAAASSLLFQTKNMLDDFPPDGPSTELLAYLAQYENIAPSNWRGYREVNLGK